jgi:uncharacterized protein (DUF736 family)
MAKQTVNRGATSNDGTGDTLRDGAGKINDNFNEIYVALGDGSSISQNTATLVSNAHLTATYATNTVVRAIETSLVAVDAAANTLIRDRMQVANTTALVNDRLQVANAQVYLTVANAQSYLEVANSGLDGILQLGSTTARDLSVGSITAAGDGNFAGNLTSFDLHANVTVLATDTNGNSTVLTIDNRNTVGNAEILISQNGNKRLKLQFSNQEFGIFANVGPANSNTPSKRRFAVDYTTGNVKFNDEYTFPNVDGVDGQVLQTNGSGLLSYTQLSGSYVANTYLQALLQLSGVQIQTSVANAYSGGANVFFFNTAGGEGNVAIWNDQSKLRTTFNLTKGVSYRFVQSDPSNAGHTIRFGTGPDGTIGGFDEYTHGITRTGTPGSSGAATTIKVPMDAPACLFFYSSGQASMGGTNDNNKTPLLTQEVGAFTDVNGGRDMTMKDDLVVDAFSNTSELTFNLPPSDEGLNLNLANNSITVRTIGNNSSPFAKINNNGHKIEGQTANVHLAGHAQYVSLAYKNASNGFIILEHSANVYLRTNSTDGHNSSDQL